MLLHLQRLLRPIRRENLRLILSNSILSASNPQVARQSPICPFYFVLYAFPALPSSWAVHRGDLYHEKSMDWSRNCFHTCSRGVFRRRRLSSVMKPTSLIVNSSSRQSAFTCVEEKLANCASRLLVHLDF
eukprot:m.641141 g.641141  ORF g.641141 m.641141 type:complete len:130 (+) comp58345_c0_seq4:1647-2036(+)